MHAFDIISDIMHWYQVAETPMQRLPALGPLWIRGFPVLWVWLYFGCVPTPDSPHTFPPPGTLNLPRRVCFLMLLLPDPFFFFFIFSLAVSILGPFTPEPLVENWRLLESLGYENLLRCTLPDHSAKDPFFHSPYFEVTLSFSLASVSASSLQVYLHNLMLLRVSSGVLWTL